MANFTVSATTLEEGLSEGWTLEVDLTLGVTSLEAAADDRFWASAVRPGAAKDGLASASRSSEALPLSDTTLTVLANAFLRVKVTKPDEFGNDGSRTTVAYAAIPFSDAMSAAGAQRTSDSPFVTSLELRGHGDEVKGKAEMTVVLGALLAEHVAHGRILTLARFEIDGEYVQTADEMRAAAAAAAAAKAVADATPGDEATPGTAETLGSLGTPAQFAEGGATGDAAPAAGPPLPIYALSLSVPCGDGEQPVALGGAVVTRNETSVSAKWESGSVSVFLGAESALPRFAQSLSLRVDVSARAGAPSAGGDGEADAAAAAAAAAVSPTGDGSDAAPLGDWALESGFAVFDLSALRRRGCTYTTPAAPIEAAQLLRADWTVSCSVVLSRALEREIPGAQVAEATSASGPAVQEPRSAAVGHARCATYGQQERIRARARALAEQRVASSVALLGAQISATGEIDIGSTAFKSAAMDASVKRLELAQVEGSGASAWTSHRVNAWLMQTIEELRQRARTPAASTKEWSVQESSSSASKSSSLQAEWLLQCALEAEWRGDVNVATRCHQERVAALANDTILGAEAWASLGRALLRSGDAAKGIAAIQHSITLAPTSRFASGTTCTLAAAHLLNDDIDSAAVALAASSSSRTTSVELGFASLIKHFRKLDTAHHPTVEDLIASLADGSDQLGAVASAGSAAAAVADARRRSSAEGVEFGAKLAAVQTLVDAAAASLEADSEGYALVGQALAWLRTDPSASAAGAVAVAQQQSRLECRCASIAIDAAAAAARSFAAVVDAATDSFDPRAHWQLARAYAFAYTRNGGSSPSDLRELALASMRTANQLAMADAPDESLRLAEVGDAAYGRMLDIHICLPHELGVMLLDAGAAQPSRRVFATATSALSGWGMAGSELLSTGLSRAMLVAGDVAASEDVLHAAVTLNPQSVYPWVALAQLACAKQKVGEARLLADRFLELATGVNASLPSLAAGLAAAFAKAGDTVYAEALQRRASA